MARTCKREQAGNDEPEPHAAQAQHRVLLVQPVDRLQQPQVVLVGLALGLGEGDAHGQLGAVGKELVQRRVEQPDGHRQPVHRLEDALEVLALQGKQRLEGVLLLLVALGQDEPLDVLLAIAEEHVLGPAQPDALGSHAAGAVGVLGGVGVGAHPHAPGGVGVLHEPVHRPHQVAGLGRLGSRSPSKYCTTGEGTTATSPR